MTATFLAVILTVIYLLSVIGKVRLIGEPREPFTRNEAAGSIVLHAMCIAFIWVLWAL